MAETGLKGRKKGARPNSQTPDIKIDPEELSEIAACGCSMGEAAAWYGCSVAEFRTLIKVPQLRGIWRRGQRVGRVMLRRAQFRMAEKNLTMALHLGRHLLGQSTSEDTPRGQLTVIVETGIDRGPSAKD